MFQVVNISEIKYEDLSEKILTLDPSLWRIKIGKEERRKTALEYATSASSPRPTESQVELVYTHVLENQKGKLKFKIRYSEQGYDGFKKYQLVVQHRNDDSSSTSIEKYQSPSEWDVIYMTEGNQDLEKLYNAIFTKICAPFMDKSVVEWKENPLKRVKLDSLLRNWVKSG